MKRETVVKIIQNGSINFHDLFDQLRKQGFKIGYACIRAHLNNLVKTGVIEKNGNVYKMAKKPETKLEAYQQAMHRLPAKAKYDTINFFNSIINKKEVV